MPCTSVHDSSKFMEGFEAASVKTDAVTALLMSPPGLFVTHTGWTARLFVQLFFTHKHGSASEAVVGVCL